MPGQPRATSAPAMQHHRTRSTGGLIVLVVFLAVALGIRLDGIGNPPFENAVARQFHAALLARIYYLGDSPKVNARDRQVLEAWRAEEQPIEPPLMELLAAGAYHVVGHEALSIPRTLSALWWTFGGLLLFIIARRFQRVPAALAAAAIYLLLPFAIVASRSFQPDPLLVLTMLAAVLAIIRWDESPTSLRLATATAASSLAFFVKPGIAVPIVGATFVVFSMRQFGFRRKLLSSALAPYSLSILPMLGWYMYGSLAHTYLHGQFSDKVSPSLLFDSSYWNGWWDQVQFVLTYPIDSPLLTAVILVMSALGIVVARAPGRTLLAGLWIGYALYGFVFTFHISTHNYYSLPLVPIVALSLASLVDLVHSRIGVRDIHALLVIAVAGLVASTGIAWKLHPKLADNFRSERLVYEQSGRAADHTARALYVDTHYGEPARYYGWTAGTLLTSGWETDPDGLATRTLAEALRRNPPPSCVILIGRPLRARLSHFEARVASRAAVVEKKTNYAVFDLDRKPGQRSNGC